eukprot:TRINITY_DN8109_c0_g2_i1.p1 TRINITY_DN8109_c0_g2~~TRINITY_DN8109_c0_g2_i1.p1  ORF type:complete len:700 (+),score=115.85 TRINITY_DN8109_c0_g2_i1:88-2187(+)
MPAMSALPSLLGRRPSSSSSSDKSPAESGATMGRMRSTDSAFSVRPVSSIASSYDAARTGSTRSGTPTRSNSYLSTPTTASIMEANSSRSSSNHNVHSKRSWLEILRGRQRAATGTSNPVRLAASLSYFPMYVVKVGDVLQMKALEHHQALLQRDVVRQYKPGMRVLFVSHQWTSHDHPDKNAEQFDVLQEMLRGLARGDTGVKLCPCSTMYTQSLTPQTTYADLEDLAENGYIWYDYFSIPQPGRASANDLDATNRDLNKAVESIPFYVEHCQHFCMLAPFVTHADTKQYLSMSSYYDRGWCRAEMAAWSLSGAVGRPGLCAWAPGNALEGGVIQWLLHPPFHGDFGVEADRQRVDSLIQRMLNTRLDEFLDDGNLKAWRILKAISAYYTINAPKHTTDLKEWLQSYAFESANTWCGGWHAIHFAALEGNTEILQRLVLDEGMNVNKPTAKSRKDVAALPRMSPVHICALYLPTQLGMKCLMALKSLGANFKQRDLVGHNTLHYACLQRKRQPMIQYLLAEGCKLEAVTRMGDTAMSLSCMYGILDTTSCLLDHGAKVNVSNSAGCSPLMHASILGSPELMNFLVDSKADVNYRAKPLMASATNLVGSALMKARPDAMLSSLVRGSGNRTALMIASMMGNVGAVEVLLSAGADREAKNCNGDTALAHARSYSRARKAMKALSDRSATFVAVETIGIDV